MVGKLWKIFDLERLEGLPRVRLMDLPLSAGPVLY